MIERFEQYHKKLVEKAAVLGLKIRGLDEETPPHDEGDVAQGNVLKEMAAVYAEARTVLARLIALAVQRMADGDYDICLACEEKIPPARLAAVPWSPFCASCQDKLEEGILPGFKHLVVPRVPGRSRSFYIRQ